MKNELFLFAGMAGVKAKRLRGPMFKSVSAALRQLREHRTCASAGDHGSIQVWIDDAGQYRGSFMRWHHVEDEQVFATKSALHIWLVKTLPRQHRNDDLSSQAMRDGARLQIKRLQQLLRRGGQSRAEAAGIRTAIKHYQAIAADHPAGGKRK